MRPFGSPFLAFLALVGCAGPREIRDGRPVIAFRSGESARVAAAPAGGEYLLRGGPPAGDPPRPNDAVALRPPPLVAWQNVRRGAPLGFERGAGGELLAVSGPLKQIVPEGDYSWHAAPASASGKSEPLHTRIGEHIDIAAQVTTQSLARIGDGFKAVLRLFPWWADI
jgi:hypothetical protein